MNGVSDVCILMMFYCVGLCRHCVQYLLLLGNLLRLPYSTCGLVFCIKLVAR